MMLTGRAALLALLGALAVLVFRTGDTALVIDLAIVIAIIADVLLAARIRSLLVTRSGDAKVHLGQSGTVTVTVVNQGKRRLRGMIRDAWRPSAGATPGRQSATIMPGRRAMVTTTLTPERRGDIAAGAVTIRAAGPLGLACRQANLTAPWTVRVLPPFLSRKHLPEKLARLRELDGQHKSMIRGQGSEFDSLRPYVLGDDVRSIDWRSTARRGDVLVRTWRPERDRRIVLVLDTGRGSAGRVGGITRLDASMDAALLLTALATKAGDRVDLIAADRRVRARVVGAGRQEVLAAITGAMALLEPDLIDPDIKLMAATVLGVARQRCLVVLMTDLNPAAIEQGLLPHIQLLSARHKVLVAAVADPKVAELAAERGDATAVYNAAAAIQAQAGRAQVSAKLRRYGVDVVDAPPDRLPPALADAYLSLKAAGRL
ncbi:MAG TPA: DUF58 domain-containing protein [Streptosporangiaceae bacterium]|nr:DUF58 domain-containing protein [Streptosporangiaceae bacterium]